MSGAPPHVDAPKQQEGTMHNYYDQIKNAIDTPQAHLYGIVFLINVAVILLAFLLVPKRRTVGVLIGVIFAIPIALLGMYNIACLTKGHCNLWAWVVVVIMVLAMITSIISGASFVAIRKTVMKK